MNQTYLTIEERPKELMKEGSSPYRYTTPEDRYRHAYFEALEQACGIGVKEKI